MMNTVQGCPGISCVSLCFVHTGNCAISNIPGFTFPVRQFLLEDVFELLRFAFAFVTFICCFSTKDNTVVCSFWE